MYLPYEAGQVREQLSQWSGEFVYRPMVQDALDRSPFMQAVFLATFVTAPVSASDLLSMPRRRGTFVD